MAQLKGTHGVRGGGSSRGSSRYTSARYDNSLAAQIYRDNQAKANRGNSSNSGNSGAKLTYSSSSYEDGVKSVKKNQYNKLKNEINETNAYLEKAKTKVVALLEELDGFSGQSADSIRKMLINELEEINEAGEKLNLMYDNVTQKEIENGILLDHTIDKKYITVDPSKLKGNDSNIYIYAIQKYCVMNFCLYLRQLMRI